MMADCDVAMITRFHNMQHNVSPNKLVDSTHVIVGKQVCYTSRSTMFNQDNIMRVEDHRLLPLDMQHSRRRVGAAQRFARQ